MRILKFFFHSTWLVEFYNIFLDKFETIAAF